MNTHAGHAPLRIDHVFFQRDDFRVVEARIVLDRADAGGAWPSDHYGVLVRLRIGSLGLPTLVVMEGGYAVDELGSNVASFLEGLD